MARLRGRRSHGFRSQLERLVSLTLKKCHVPYEYEPDRLPYIKKPAKYIPDFKIGATTYIEVKGVLTFADRAKLLAVKEQHPDITICLLFGNASNRLNRKSKTTYAEWADKHNFPNIDVRDKGLVNWIKSL